MRKHDDTAFARAFAPLMEVQQNGVYRTATPNDVLEILGGPRYIFRRDDGAYASETPEGWSFRKRDALIASDRQTAQEIRKMGTSYGVNVKILRLRRPGTSHIKMVRLRKGLEVNQGDGKLFIDIPRDEAMQMLAHLTSAKEAPGKQ